MSTDARVTPRDHPLERLSPPPTRRVLQRAQDEPFSFSLDLTTAPASLVVRNERYADPENHEYRIEIDDGLPVDCTCPANAKWPPCKHRVAVAIRPVLLAVVAAVTPPRV